MACKQQNKKYYTQDVGKRLFQGFFMGLSDLIPGYSGGTTLTLFNAYDSLISNCKGILKPQAGIKRYEHLLWVLPFLLVWAVTFIALHFAVSEIKDANFLDVLTVLFASFSLGCVPIFCIVNQPKIFRKQNWKNQIAFGLGFLIILIAALVIFFLEFSKDRNDFQDDNSILNLFKNHPGRIVSFFLSGFLGGFFMIIPGISGSMIVYLFNEYWTVNFLITNSLKDPFANPNIAFLGLFGLLAICGAICSILVSSYLMKWNRELFYAFAFGMVASSFLAVLLIAPRKIWDPLANQDALHISLVVVAAIVGLAINGAILYIYKRKQAKVASSF